MDVTLVGIETDVNEVHPSNTRLWSLVTPSAIVTDVRAVQRRKVCGPKLIRSMF